MTVRARKWVKEEFAGISIPFILAASAIVLILLTVAGYFFGWGWVGVTQFTVTTGGEAAVYTQKTLWDWLDLLLVPAILAAGLWWLSRTQKAIVREPAGTSEKEERRLAQDRREEELLQRYYDRMSDLLLVHNLRQAGADNPTAKEAQNIAQARTLAVLGTLDRTRKSQVIKFLADAHLISGETPVLRLREVNLANISLSGFGLSSVMNLTGINLSRAFLPDSIFALANLSESNFSEAMLVRTNFRSSDLAGAKLSGANLSGANLSGANLSEADLSFADLSGAEICEANLSGAVLAWANLSESDLDHALLSRSTLFGANLSGAKLARAKLHGAKYTEDTVWPEDFDPQAAGARLVNIAIYEDGVRIEEPTVRQS